MTSVPYNDIYPADRLCYLTPTQQVHHFHTSPCSLRQQLGTAFSSSHIIPTYYLFLLGFLPTEAIVGQYNPLPSYP